MNKDDFELEGELRRQASAIRVDVPHGLSGRISAAVASAAEDDRPARPRRSWNWVCWMAAGGAAAAIAAGLLLARRPSASEDTRAEAAALALEIQAVPQRVLGSLQEPSAEPPPDPLHAEAVELTHSAHSALDFLAYNFLPSSKS